MVEVKAGFDIQDYPHRIELALKHLPQIRADVDLPEKLLAAYKKS